MLGFFGPATEEVQSIEEQDTWKSRLYGWFSMKLPLRCTSSTGSTEDLALPFQAGICSQQK